MLGWEVRCSTPDVALLGASGRLGLSGELLFERHQRTLLFATFVQLENRIARGLWARSRPGTGRSCRTSSSGPERRRGSLLAPLPGPRAACQSQGHDGHRERASADTS